MEYIAAVLGHLKSNAFSFPFSLFFCFNLIHLGEKNKKRGSCVTNRPIQTHTYLLEEAHMEIQFIMTMVPPSASHITNMLHS